jgi:DNA-binding CsgD family transcriptional regulator
MDARGRRAIERLEELAGRQHDLVSFWRAASEVLERAVDHQLGACWYSLDPGSLLITSHFHEQVQEFPQEWLELEYVEDDLNQIADVVASSSGISTLHELTGGDPTGTSRWQTNMQMGGDQELILRLRARSGDVWGAVGLYREQGQSLFDERDKAVLTAAAVPLAEGARRSLLFGEAQDPDWPEGPGMVVLAPSGEPDAVTESAEPWLALLGGSAGALPLSIRAAAKRVAEGEPAVQSRVRGSNDHWLTLHAARMAGDNRVAVLIQPTTPARIFDLLTAAHGLTAREQDVVQLVLLGRSTAQIAQALHVSPWTVQEHLTSVFDKMGVRSRRELVAQAFFTHYSPRFRDNERRAADGSPTRGNPAYGP